jgi:membrane-bound serine protease (ClpP class)
VIVEFLIAVIALVVAFEVFEHVVVPLIAMRAGRGRPSSTGPEGLVGRVVEVRRWSGAGGTVMVNGELWHAESRTPLSPGDTAIILGVENLTLLVKATTFGDQLSSPPDGPPRRFASPPAALAPSSTHRR